MASPIESNLDISVSWYVYLENRLVRLLYLSHEISVSFHYHLKHLAHPPIIPALLCCYLVLLCITSSFNTACPLSSWLSTISAMAHLLHRSVDSETAALILQLQRDDIEAALCQGDAHENVALQLQMQQLNLVETAHNDYTIAQSISRAVFDDRDLLTEELSAEQQAMRDRQLAQRLPQGADIPLDDSTLTDNSEDDVNDRELSITCVACTNTFPWFDILETPCSHHYCVECLSELFDLSMKDETLYPPRCCRQTIPLDDAKLVLHPKLVRDFQQKSIELDAKDRTYCYDPRCSTFIPAEHITEDVADCPDCGKRTCVICKAAAHRGDCPRDEDLQQLLQAAEHAGWQRCSSCRRVVDLRSGCNHIT